MQSLTITRPDDFHLHLRDGAEMKSVLPDSARQFARAIVMPNLKTPVVTTDQALEYRDRIIKNLPEGSDFQPLMTLYLTEKTTPDEIKKAKQSGHVLAVKYYPAGATTNSESGVTNMKRVYPILETMEEQQLLLLMHGEVTEPEVDIFDREQVFIEKVLEPIIKRFSNLKIVFEHITTMQAVEFVKSGPENLAATITPHHMLLNRNDLFTGGIQPHHYCLPVLKAEKHRQAVLDAATSGHPRFFLGTDSAPHAKHNKESACGCAGIYSALNAIELYTEVFEKAGCIEKLEAFASQFGAGFYGLPFNKGTITLEKKQWKIPDILPFGKYELVPFRAGGICHWKLA